MADIVKRLTVPSPLENRVYQVYRFEPHDLMLEINSRYPEKANRFAVNLGSGDGRSMNDPVYPLFMQGFGGMAVEGDDNKALYANLPAANITKLAGLFITPHNVRETLDLCNCPRDCDFFKLDIDSCDGIILKTVLEAGYVPKLLQIEVNPEIPPPLSFAVHYDEKFRTLDSAGLIGGFYGVSLAFVADLCSRFGYHIAQLDFFTEYTHDVTLVHDDYLPVVREIAGTEFLNKPLRDKYLDHPPGWYHFEEYDINPMPWRSEQDPYSLIRTVWAACNSANLRKHKGYSVPFQLSL